MTGMEPCPGSPKDLQPPFQLCCLLCTPLASLPEVTIPSSYINLAIMSNNWMVVLCSANLNPNTSSILLTPMDFVPALATFKNMVISCFPLSLHRIVCVNKGENPRNFLEIFYMDNWKNLPFYEKFLLSRKLLFIPFKKTIFQSIIKKKKKNFSIKNKVLTTKNDKLGFPATPSQICSLDSWTSPLN